jgi:hypothetical protein
MDVVVTLNSGLGAGLGPNFTLSANTGSITPSTATLAQLLTGVTCSVVSGATGITVCSVGVCTNCISLEIIPVTTTTTTTTTTTSTTSTSTTSTSTTTTTEEPEPNGYNIELYTCGSCDFADYGFVEVTIGDLTVGEYYYLSSGYIGLVTSTGVGIASDTISSFSGYSSCIGLPCA